MSARALRSSHSGTPSSSTARMAAPTPVLRKYFCAMMSTATCDQPAGIVTPGASNTTEPSGFTIRESRAANGTPS